MQLFHLRETRKVGQRRSELLCSQSNLFLTAFSVLPGSILDISHQLFRIAVDSVNCRKLIKCIEGSPIAEVALSFIQYCLFGTAPIAFLNVGIKMVKPPLSTLLSDAARKLDKPSQTGNQQQKDEKLPEKQLRTT